MRDGLGSFQNGVGLRFVSDLGVKPQEPAFGAKVHGGDQPVAVLDKLEHHFEDLLRLLDLILANAAHSLGQHNRLFQALFGLRDLIAELFVDRLQATVFRNVEG